MRILDAISDPAEREWYMRQAIEHEWSHNVLVHQINLQEVGKELTNLYSAYLNLYRESEILHPARSNLCARSSLLALAFP